MASGQIPPGRTQVKPRNGLGLIWIPSSDSGLFKGCVSPKKKVLAAAARRRLLQRLLLPARRRVLRSRRSIERGGGRIGFRRNWATRRSPSGRSVRNKGGTNSRACQENCFRGEQFGEERAKRREGRPHDAEHSAQKTRIPNMHASPSARVGNVAKTSSLSDLTQWH